MLGRFGTGPVRRLVLEAASPKTRPGHRVRLLRAIKRIGTVLDAATYLDLHTFLHDKNADVRAAAEDLLGTLRDRQAEPAAEPAAAQAASTVARHLERHDTGG